MKSRDLNPLSLRAVSESYPSQGQEKEKKQLQANNTAFFKETLFLVHIQAHSLCKLIQRHLSNDLEVSRHFRSQLIVFPLRAHLHEKIKMLFVGTTVGL